MRYLELSVNHTLLGFIHFESQTHSNITVQKTKFSFKDFYSKCEQIRRKLRVYSHLLNNSLTENFIFYAAYAGFNLFRFLHYMGLFLWTHMHFLLNCLNDFLIF